MATTTIAEPTTVHQALSFCYLVAVAQRLDLRGGLDAVVGCVTARAPQRV